MSFFKDFNKQLAMIIIAAIIASAATFVSTSLNRSRKNRETLIRIEEHLLTVQSEIKRNGAGIALNESNVSEIRIDLAKIKGKLDIK